MKHRTRYLLALTLVATTLCAGRLFASEQAQRGESKAVTEKLVARLTRSFSRTVSQNPLVVQRQLVSAPTQPLLIVATDRAHSIALSPFESRLPPPLV
jgi:hypothetical protein